MSKISASLWVAKHEEGNVSNQNSQSKAVRFSETTSRPWQHVTADISQDGRLRRIRCYSRPCRQIHKDGAVRPNNLTFHFCRLSQSLLCMRTLPIGSPRDFNRGNELDARFRQTIAQMVGIDPRMSTAYHLQMDIANPWLKQYFGLYVGSAQSNGTSLLAHAELCCSSHVGASTGISLLGAVTGYEQSLSPRDSVVGAFEILKQINENVFRLELARPMRIHPVLRATSLRHYVKRENGNPSANANVPANMTHPASTSPSANDNLPVITAPRSPKIEVVVDERSSTENTKEFLTKWLRKPPTDNPWISLQQAQRDDRREELLQYHQASRKTTPSNRPKTPRGWKGWALEPIDKPQPKETTTHGPNSHHEDCLNRPSIHVSQMYGRTVTIAPRKIKEIKRNPCHRNHTTRFNPVPFYHHPHRKPFHLSSTCQTFPQSHL
nr:hypothetical protein L204_04699 [Cryptococcus depauperatus CBS 7855]